jgi:hypothetical protein
MGLETVRHTSPSSVAVECLYRSGNNLPMQFLEGVGFSKILLQYLPELVSAGSPIQFHSCFISYSHTDEAFARRLWLSMKDEGIRVWYAPEEMKAGKKLFDQIDRAIQLHDKLLIILSKESIASNWVQTELRRARREERLRNERKLFPIRLCDMQTLRDWVCFDADAGQDLAQELREYFISDFSQWREPAPQFEEAFEKLTSDLRVEGVPMRCPPPSRPVFLDPYTAVLGAERIHFVGIAEAHSQLAAIWALTPPRSPFRLLPTHPSTASRLPPVQHLLFAPQHGSSASPPGSAPPRVPSTATSRGASSRPCPTSPPNRSYPAATPSNH